eukprot:2492274-Prymnesium_polylepis.1
MAVHLVRPGQYRVASRKAPDDHRQNYAAHRIVRGVSRGQHRVLGVDGRLNTLGRARAREIICCV